jgi:hypothetical protein
VDGLVRVNARGTPEEVHGRVREALARRYPETFARSGFTSV